MDEIIRLSVHAGDFVLPDFNYGCWGKNKRRNGIVRYCLSRELGRTMAQYLGFSEHGINNRVQAIYYPHFDNLFAMRDMVGVWKRYSGYLRLTQYINANYRLFEVLPFVWVNGLSLNRSDLGGVLFSYSGKVQPKRAAYICDFEVSIHEHRLVRGFRLIAREGADGFCILPIDTRYWDLSSSYGLWPLPDPIISPNWPCFIEQDTTFVGRYREWGGDRHKKDYYFNDVDGRGSYYPLTVKKKASEC